MKIRYTVVTGNMLSVFCDEVSKMLKKGWKLQGGIAIYRGLRGDEYYQALTLEY